MWVKFSRWLLSQGKIEKCTLILKRIAKTNGRKVDDEVFSRFIETNLEALEEERKTNKMDNLTLMDLFRKPRLRKILALLCVMWMSTSFVFDGHARNAGSIGSDIFVVHTIGSFTEFPADIFLVMILDSWGRRWPCGGALILGGIFSLVATLVPFGK